MNVTDPLFPHPSNSSAASTTVPAPKTFLTSTATADSSEPTQHYWTMSSYLAISLPLTTVVVVLPLIAPPCFRFVLQQYDRHRRHWRACYVVCIVLYFIVLIALYYSQWDMCWLAYMFMGYTVVGMNIYGRVVMAYRIRRARFRWSLALCTMAPCISMDLFLDLSLPWVLVPFSYILLMSTVGVQWLERAWTWLSGKAKRQSVAVKLSPSTV